MLKKIFFTFGTSVNKRPLWHYKGFQVHMSLEMSQALDIFCPVESLCDLASETV